LTSCEDFSLTKKITEQLCNINHSRYSISGPLCSRCLASLIIPLTSLSDAAFHSILFLGKGTMGTLISPYNCLAMLFSPKFQAPKELEFSSALIHLMRVVDSLFNTIFLTALAILDPDRADAWVSRKAGNSVRSALENLEKEKLNQDLRLLKLEAQGKETLLLQKNGEISSKTLEIGLLNEQNFNLRQQLAEKEMINDQFMQEIEAKNSTIKRLAINTDMGVQLLTDKFNLLQRARDLKNTCKELKERDNLNQTRLTELQAKLAEEENRLSAKEEDLQTLSCNLQQEKETNLKLKEELQKKIDDKSEEIETINQTIENLKNEKNQIEEAKNEAVAINTSLLEKLKEASKNILELTEKCAKCEEALLEKSFFEL
ncbi:MAG: hypothetical protein LW832_02980, partial [Parachlamydia sp.]|nr:hypothetical protein [Parachlamydia sp.]